MSDVPRNEERREWWIGKGDPNEDKVFKTRSEAFGYSNVTIPVREVLPGDEGKRLFSWDEIEDAIDRCTKRGYGGDYLDMFKLERALFSEGQSCGEKEQV